MSLTTDFNVNPYYDDFDEDKKFLRILFKPGYSVQARELTQLQTIIQNQLQKFGNNIFTNGSFIIGGQSFVQECISLKIAPTYGSSSVVASNFSGITIYSDDGNKRAEVIVAVAADTNALDPITLLIKQIYGDPFIAGDVIRDVDSLYFATISLSLPSAVGTGLAFSLSEGVFYYGGYFIKTDSQSIAISKYYNSLASVKVGFEIYEYNVSATDDSTLIDPAQQATNYQAPGADRYKVELILSTRDITSTSDLENFIEISRFNLGVLQPSNKASIYNKIGDEMAKRTYEESGNYVVAPFNLLGAKELNVDTSKIDLYVGPGKAYVRGYEIDAKVSQKITISAARDTTNTSSGKIAGAYGNYLLTENQYRTFDTSTIPSVFLYCVPYNDVGWDYEFRTRIGSANVKSIEFVTTANTLSGADYIYSLDLFNINVSSIASSTGTNSETVIELDAYSSTVTDAYVGAYLEISNGDAAVGESRLITSYDGNTFYATVNPPFSAAPDNGADVRLHFNTQQIRSVIEGPLQYNPSVDVSSLVGVDPTNANRTILFDNKIEELIFDLQMPFPVSVDSVEYQYVRQFALDLDTGSVVADINIDLYGTATTEADQRENYQFVCTSVGGAYVGPVLEGEVIPSGLVTVTDGGTTQPTFAVLDGEDMSIEVLSTMTTTGLNLRNKIYSPATPFEFPHSDPGLSNDPDVVVIENSPDRVLYPNHGHFFHQPNSDEYQDIPIILYVTDVIRIVKIYDWHGNINYDSGNTYEDATLFNAVDQEGANDVTDHFILDNGQRDSFYGYASIRLKSNKPKLKGPFSIQFDRFIHPDTAGYFCVNSYPAEMYANCSTYTSSAGKYYNLRDSIDFRPSLKEAAYSGSWIGEWKNGGNSKTVKRGSTISYTSSHYLPRIDKLTLNTDGQFNVLTGVPAANPQSPQDNDDSITLYEIRVPAYTNDSANLIFTAVTNRRYTMADIGGLEKRIKNLEYYTTLSLLENDALSKSDPSLYGRSKNGIITDSFVGFNTVDVNSRDFTAGIDLQSNELKTTTVINPFPLRFYANGSTAYSKSASLIYLTSDENVMFAEQPSASEATNVNPFNVQLFIGSIRLLPQSDVWIDTENLPALNVQDAGNAQMRAFINDTNQWAQVTWGSWRNLGASTSVSTGWSVNTWSNSKRINTEHFENLTTAQGQTRTGTLLTYRPDEVKTSLGQKIVSSGIYPFMRKKDIWFKLSDFKPLSLSYGFFNDTDINKYIAKHNIFTINLESSFANTAAQLSSIFNGTITESHRGVRVDINQQYGNSPYVVGSAIVSHCSNRLLYVTDVFTFPGVVDANGVIPWNSGNISITPNDPVLNAYFAADPFYALYGTPTWKLAQTNGFVHSYANVQVDVVPTVSSFKLNRIAKNSSFYLANIVGSPIRIVESGGGSTGTQTSTITAYDPDTSVISFTPAFSEAPTSNSIYNIGQFKTDISGRGAGTFYMPAGIFRTPEQKFRMTDDSLGGFDDASSRGDSAFFAQGQFEKTQETILSTIVPREVITQLNQQQTTYSYSQVYRYTTAKKKDPVAETFTVDPVNHPDGIFISKVRVCFKAVDESLPVTLQIRPTVNGYPSSTQIYPFSEVSRLPDELVYSDYPSLDDETKYTDFIFESPVYLLPGEHSFVVLTNSNKYEIWTATKNRRDVNTQQTINNQPYLGSFFKSQNGSTWTAEQETDMMFRLYYHQFDDSQTADVKFEIESASHPTTNVYSDLLILQTQEIDIGNTALSYTFKSQVDKVSGIRTEYLPITPRKDHFMNDGYGRRIITKNDIINSNSSFSLKVSMGTRNPDVSPVIDIERFGIIAIEQRLNNLGLVPGNSTITVIRYGSGPLGGYYEDPDGPIATISGGGGSGATANVIMSNQITYACTAVYSVESLSIVQPGSGYYCSPNVSFSGGDQYGSPGDGYYAAQAKIFGEDWKKGGNSVCRYLTKRITLADGFNSADLRVYLSVHKPINSAIHVYYKILAAGDMELWQDRVWQTMTQIAPNLGYYSENIDDFNELVFAPGINNIANNSIQYSSPTSGKFNDFTTFAIKIVMSGVDTIDIPRVKDFRAIATQSI